MMNLLIARLRQLPWQPKDIWQGGLFKLPRWVRDEPEEEPYRCWAAGWLSLKA
jgi:hypothetical protein